MAISRGLPFKTGGPAGPAWAPTDLGGDLTLWLQPSGLNSTGSNITSWTDNSGLGNNFTAVAGTPQKVLFTSGLNGAQFNGIADYIEGPLTSAVILSATNLHCFIVCQQDGDGGANNTASGYFHNTGYFVDTGNVWGVYQRTLGGPTDFVQEGANTTTTSRFSTAAANTRSVPMCIEAWLTSDGTLHTKVAGGTDNTAAIDAALRSGIFDTMRLADSPSGGELACTIGEVIFVDRSLTGGEQTSARTYITNKWGVAA